MFIGQWKYDGDAIYESEVSFEKNLPPIALLRAVRNGIGAWDAIVREAQTERKLMIGSRPNFTTAEDAMGDCYRILKAHFDASTCEIGPVNETGEYHVVHRTNIGPSAGAITRTTYESQSHELASGDERGWQGALVQRCCGGRS